MIDFELPENIKIAGQMVHGVAKDLMRKWARWADDHEHEKVEEYCNFMYEAAKAMDRGIRRWFQEEGEETRRRP